MSKQKIQPCPFCGNNDREWLGVLIDEEGEHRVKCGACHAGGPIMRFATTAITAWNERKAPKAEVASE